MKTYHADNDLYGYRLYLTVGGDSNKAARWLADKLGEDYTDIEHSQPAARTIYSPLHRDHMIWFEQTPVGSCAAHEAFHSACHVMRYVGIGTLSKDSEEAYAYLIGWTVAQIGNKFWK